MLVAPVNLRSKAAIEHATRIASGLDLHQGSGATRCPRKHVALDLDQHPRADPASPASAAPKTPTGHITLWETDHEGKHRSQEGS
jgi:hypothetical protein